MGTTLATSSKRGLLTRRWVMWRRAARGGEGGEEAFDAGDAEERVAVDAIEAVEGAAPEVFEPGHGGELMEVTQAGGEAADTMAAAEPEVDEGGERGEADEGTSVAVPFEVGELREGIETGEDGPGMLGADGDSMQLAAGSDVGVVFDLIAPDIQGAEGGQVAEDVEPGEFEIAELEIFEPGQEAQNAEIARGAVTGPGIDFDGLHLRKEVGNETNALGIEDGLIGRIEAAGLAAELVGLKVVADFILAAVVAGIHELEELEDAVALL